MAEPHQLGWVPAGHQGHAVGIGPGCPEVPRTLPPTVPVLGKKGEWFQPRCREWPLQCGSPATLGALLSQGTRSPASSTASFLREPGGRPLSELGGGRPWGQSCVRSGERYTSRKSSLIVLAPQQSRCVPHAGRPPPAGCVKRLLQALSSSDRWWPLWPLLQRPCSLSFAQAFPRGRGLPGGGTAGLKSRCIAKALLAAGRCSPAHTPSLCPAPPPGSYWLPFSTLCC